MRLNRYRQDCDTAVSAEKKKHENHKPSAVGRLSSHRSCEHEHVSAVIERAEDKHYHPFGQLSSWTTNDDTTCLL